MRFVRASADSRSRRPQAARALKDRVPVRTAARLGFEDDRVE